MEEHPIKSFAYGILCMYSVLVCHYQPNTDISLFLHLYLVQSCPHIFLGLKSKISVFRYTMRAHAAAVHNATSG